MTNITNENQKLSKDNGKYENVDKYIIPGRLRYPLKLNFQPNCNKRISTATNCNGQYTEELKPSNRK